MYTVHMKERIMVRKQFYITQEEEDHLIKMANLTSVAASEYLRRIIDADIDRVRKLEWHPANANKDKRKQDW